VAVVVVMVPFLDKGLLSLLFPFFFHPQKEIGWGREEQAERNELKQNS